MALIKFEIDDTVTPAVLSDHDVLNLHPGDRLLFTSKSAADVLVNLGGDENSSTLVALVKQKGPPNFDFGNAGGKVTVKLKAPVGSGPESDPP